MKKISIFIMLFAFLTLLNIQVNAEESLVENTLALCTDGLDNNGNLLTDLADPDCSAFRPVIVAVENTLILCTDGLDNNSNLLTDLADPDCSAFRPTPATTTPVVEVPVVVTPTNTSGPSFGGGSSGGFSSVFSSITSGTPVSSVITGTSTGTTTCGIMFTTYMKKGKKNNMSEVKRLQAFLNQNLGLNIPVTGLYGTITMNAVKKFQAKYMSEILTPWSVSATTGYFYKTTQRQANLLMCSALDIPMPVLN